MKKSLLTVLSILVIFSTINIAQANSDELMTGIKLYRAGDYSACYVKMSNLVETDPSNALAYYYLAMAASQVGKKAEAIDNYNKVISLTSITSNIGRYANKGKVCLENPESCDAAAVISNVGDNFILNKQGPKFSEEAREQFENLKLEELKRDINRDEIIEPQRFKEYKDFSTMNNLNGVPTNDEIVAALRTLQKAGFGNIMNNGYNDLSILTGMGQQNPMLNMLGGNSSLSPQIIQTLLTNNMSQGF